MIKKIIIILIILGCLVTAGVVYLNKTYLPSKVKGLVIKAIEDKTHKKVTLQSAQLNIFKGLVLGDLKIIDQGESILELKEASCTFLFWPFFKKQLILPTITFQSPKLLLERRPDNSLNISEWFMPVSKEEPQQGAKTEKKNKFNVFVYKVSIRNGSLNFIDNTISPPFSKNAEKINLDLNLSMPAGIKFNLKSEIDAKTPIKLSAAGQYRFDKKQLMSKITLEDFSANEFMVYLKKISEFSPQGLIDARATMNFKDNIVKALVSAESDELNFKKDKLHFKLNSEVNAQLNYNLASKKLDYSGTANIERLDTTGIHLIESINAISGDVKFDNSGLSSEDLDAQVLGVPVNAKLSVRDFSKPTIKISLSSAPDLGTVKNFLRDKLKVSAINDLQGKSRFDLNITSFPQEQALEINGSIDIQEGLLKIKNIAPAFEAISGKIEFHKDRLNLTGMNFRCLGKGYKIVGTMSNFHFPQVKLSLSSSDFKLDSAFSVANKLIEITKFSGNYLSSDFSLFGSLNTSDPLKIKSGLNGEVNINLDEIGKDFKAINDKLKKIKPSGMLKAKFNLSGPINDFKNCTLESLITGQTISLFGLKLNNLSLNADLQNRVLDIPRLQLALYGGAMDASARLNLSSTNLPFVVNAQVQNVLLEQLKLDTAMKKQDISGTLQAQLQLNGTANDINSLNGMGQIAVRDGKLWQLDLFKGMGALLFTTDFSKIVFSQASCDFTVQNKYIFSNNIDLKSNLANISGKTRIGFDNSIDAELNVQISESVPLTGTFKDVTTAFLGKSDKFGVIKITGTLKEPKYKFKTSVVDIVNTLTGIFLGK